MIARIQSAELEARHIERREGGDRHLSMIKTHLEMARLIYRERARYRATEATIMDPEGPVAR